jgi:hypothetical protein
MLSNFHLHRTLKVTMNSIRALNVRTNIEEIPGHHPNPKPGSDAPSSYIAPLAPAMHPVSEKPAAALSSKPASTA